MPSLLSSARTLFCFAVAATPVADAACIPQSTPTVPTTEVSSTGHQLDLIPSRPDRIDDMLSAWPGGGGSQVTSEQLLWDYERSARGAVLQTHGPPDGAAGTPKRTYSYNLTYGDALPRTQTNPEGHVVTTTYSPQGHVYEETDPNGVVSTTDTDAFGRPVRSAVTPPGESVYTLSEAAYTDNLYGADKVKTTIYDWSDPGTYSTRDTWAIVDGFGRTMQSWVPASDASNWLVTETHHDYSGNVLRTSDPFAKPLSVDPGAIWHLNDHDTSSGWAACTLYDGVGRPREAGKQCTVGISGMSSAETVVTSYPVPGTTQQTDALGDLKELHHDVHGRLTSVYEGSAGSALTLTGGYAYDGQDRISRFSDAENNAWFYRFDGAGRLAEVQRKPDGGTTEDWFTYTYIGAEPVQMFGPTGDLMVEWTYDRMGRPIQKDLYPSGGGAVQTFTWLWDTRWIGSRTSSSDPAGTTNWYYDNTTWGALGQASSVQRDWTDVSLPPYAVDYVHDVQGRMRSTTWTNALTNIELAQLTQTFDTNGFLSLQEVESPNCSVGDGLCASIVPTYDAFDLPGGYVSSTGHQLDLIRSRPDRIDDMLSTWPGGGGSQVAYNYAMDGQLSAKEVTLYTDGTGATQAVHALEYSYDALKRLTQVELDASTVESYAYSDNNNLLQSIVDGTTTNYVQNRFSEPVQRTAPHGQEQLVWDDKGRLARRDMPRAAGDNRKDRWTYAYDGAGRLTQVRQQVVTPTSPPLPQVVSTTATSSYAYDVDDNLVHETHDMGSVARFAGIRVDTRPGGELLVKVLPGVTVVEPGSAPDVRWSFIEYDGHALETADSSNTRASFELLGGYGAVLVSAGDPLPTDRFHGSDPDLGMGVVPMGVRHITETDGLWLQPEPLLYLGMTNGDVSNPRAYTGVYAAGNPVCRADASGEHPLLLVGVAVGVAVTVDAGAISVTGAAVGIAAIAGGAMLMTGHEASDPGSTSSTGDGQAENLEAENGASGAAGEASQGGAANPARENKKRHIFGKPEHGLQDVVEELGGEEEALTAIEGAVQGAADAGEVEGVFETEVEVGSSNVTVRGRVVDGEAKVGTAFIPEAGN